MYGSYDHMKSVAILGQACLERAPFCPELSAFPFASSPARPPPTTTMAVALSPELTAVLQANAVHAKFTTWLLAQGMVTCEDLATMAHAEDLVKANIIAACKTDVPEAAAVGETVRITKAWRACRKSLDVADKTKTGDSADLEVPLDEPTKRSLSEAWTKRHNFVLSDGRLLIENLQGRVYREINLDPPRFSVFFLEQLRVLSSLERKSHLALLVKPGQAAQGTAVVADVVDANFELFVRGRALFSTVAYASIHKPDWFGFGDAEFISDKLLGFINQEFNHQRPPLAFYINAWAATMQRFSESVRMNKCTLSSVVRASSNWEHLWTMWTPESMGPSGGSVAAPDDRKLQDEVERLRKYATSLQSEKDRAFAQAETMRRQLQNGSGKGSGSGAQKANGGGGGGNGSGKGNGGGNNGNNGNSGNNNNNNNNGGGGKSNGGGFKRQRGNHRR